VKRFARGPAAARVPWRDVGIGLGVGARFGGFAMIGSRTAAREEAREQAAARSRRRRARLAIPGLALLFAGLSALGTASAHAEDGTPVTPPESHHGSVRPYHLSVGSGTFRPWDGNRGYDVSAMFHRGFGSDRFWVGAELEFRHFEAEIKQDFRPDYDSYGVRFQFQYHPFPKAILSPYVGVGVGFLIHSVEDEYASGAPGDKVRGRVSGGTTLLGLAGVEMPVPFAPALQIFGEARIGNASDLWKRKGGNYQMDQVGGFTGMGGLRVRFE